MGVIAREWCVELHGAGDAATLEQGEERDKAIFAFHVFWGVYGHAYRKKIAVAEWDRNFLSIAFLDCLLHGLFLAHRI